MQSAANLAHGQCGLTDGSTPGMWRLPTIKWEAMIDKRYSGPALSNAAGTGQWTEGDAFFSVQPYAYMSCTITYTAYTPRRVDKTCSIYVWPVKDRH